MATHHVILTTPDGKYIWWPALQHIDYIRKGNRRPDQSEMWTLSSPRNTPDGAVLGACRIEIKRRKS